MSTLKLERDVEQLKQTLGATQKSLFFQVTPGLFIPPEL